MIIPVSSVRFFASNHKLTEIWTQSRTYYCDESLVNLEKILPDFVRASRRLLVAKNNVVEISGEKAKKGLAWYVHTRCGERLRVSRREACHMKQWAESNDVVVRRTNRVKTAP